MSLFFLSTMSLFCFILAMIAVMVQYKHILMVLLSLEAAGLSCFVLLFCLLNNVGFSGYGSLIFITLAACEASLGLSILVCMIRMKGNDYVSSFSLQKC